MDRGRRLARRVVAPALVAGGFVLTLGGNAIGGLALVLAGWMARAAVRAADRRDRLQGLLDGITVGDVMETTGPAVAPHVTLDAFVPELDETTDVGAVRVVADGSLVGIVGPREVARVPRSRWSAVRAGEAMTATASLPGLAPGEPLGPAAERLGSSGATGWPVVADGRPIGILTRTAVGRILQARLQAADAGVPGNAGLPSSLGRGDATSGMVSSGRAEGVPPAEIVPTAEGGTHAEGMPRPPVGDVDAVPESTDALPDGSVADDPSPDDT